MTWQTIESHPTQDNGGGKKTFLILTNKGNVMEAEPHPTNGWCYRPSELFAIPLGEWRNKTTNGGPVKEVATHWMPMPDPPKELT